MKKDDVLELKIESYAYEGRGIAKLVLNEEEPEKKYIVFVDKTYPGDVVKAIIKKKKSNYAEAILQEIIKPSDLRIEAKCKHFNDCGGCKQQDLNYETQLKFKSEQVVETFQHIGLVDNFEVENIIPCSQQFYYRNKMEFSAADKRWISKEEFDLKGEVTDRNFALGLHIPRIFDKVLDLDECFLQSETSTKVLNFTRKFFKTRGISAYSTKYQTGYVRNLVIKQAHFTIDFMVNLVTSEENDQLMQEYTSEIIKEIPEITTIVNNINQKKSQVAYGDYEKVYFGDGYIHDFIGEYKFRISANSFFQVNTRQAVNLYQTALDYAELTGNEILFDLYSGAGTIAIFMSKFAKKIYTMESSESSIEDAKFNLKVNQIENVFPFTADLNKSFLPLIDTENIPIPDIIVTDPPRSGMNPKTIQDILKISPKKIVYISCNPATQARDIKLLVESGYKLVKIKSVDMFPQTFHIENVALLTKK